MENIDSLNVAIAGGIILNSLYNDWFLYFLL
jgi:tRNA G18 (ribose-2'-O)-methylase SpoU